MKNLGIEFKVGLFTLVGLFAAGYLFFVLSPESFDSKETKIYYTVLEDAAGIVPKTHVKTNGVSIGKVKSVELGTSNTKIFLEVDADVKIPKGSTIEVRSVGLLGENHIEIIRRPEEGQGYVEDGGYLPRSTDSVDMNKLVSIAGSVLKDIKKVTESLGNALGGPDGEKTVSEIVDDIRAITAHARGILEDNREDIRVVVANFRKSSDSLAGIFNSENKERIDRILALFDESMVDVRGATKNINLIADKIEKGEGTLGKLINDDEAIEELKAAVKDFREVLAPMTKLQVEVDYHGEVRNDASTQNYFNLVFRVRPDRYYILGFTDREYDTVTTTTSPSQTDPDGKVTETKTVKEQTALAFNLQFAKRWGPLAMRFGLFENTGGLASDLFLWQDRIRFSFEAFDWKSKDNPVRRVAHLKSYLSVLFYNHVYAMAGVDDMTRLDQQTGEPVKEPNYFVGAGLTFNDQDLKALFGAAALAR